MKNGPLPNISTEELKRIVDPQEAEKRHQELMARAAQDPELQQAIAERNRMVEEADRNRVPLLLQEAPANPRPNLDTKPNQRIRAEAPTKPKGFPAAGAIGPSAEHAHENGEPEAEPVKEEERWTFKLLAVFAILGIIGVVAAIWYVRSEPTTELPKEPTTTAGASTAGPTATAAAVTATASQTQSAAVEPTVSTPSMTGSQTPSSQTSLVATTAVSQPSGIRSTATTSAPTTQSTKSTSTATTSARPSSSIPWYRPEEDEKKR